MKALWSEQAQFEAWLTVELEACTAWAKLGEVPYDDVARLRKNASFSLSRIHEIEKTTRHDVVAFTRAVSESLGPERKWIHYGLTSSDVVDTAWGLRLKKAGALVLEAADRLLSALKERALEHKDTIVMGRTHGVHAEPTTLGLKMALFLEEMRRNRARLTRAIDAVAVGKLSGAVGTYAHTPPEVEQHVCDALGLTREPVATQVVQRDRHAHFVAALALTGATLEKIATEIRHLQRTEVREAEEAFRPGQKGSSAMPHKRNPIGSENITGCARLLRGYMVTAYENVALWHERDISHSSAERVILPDATTIVHYALHRMSRIVRNLVVYPYRMRRNLAQTFGLYHSQQVLNQLIDSGLSREAAYDLVQPLAMRAWNKGQSFKTLMLQDPEIQRRLPREIIEAAFDDAAHLRHVDTIFARLGLL